MSNILLVEDDVSLAEWIMEYLNAQGFSLSLANRGDMAVDLIAADLPDLVILDVLLPGKNGFDVCKEVRKFYKKPILMLTACNEEADEVLGLELGATDFIAKPVRPRVLLARVKALLRRSEITEVGDKLIFGSLVIDNSNKTVLLAEQDIILTASEFELLWQLAQQASVIVSRDALLKNIRGIEYDGFDRSIDIAISRLRKKLNDSANPPKRIKTIRNKGYLFAADAWD